MVTRNNYQSLETSVSDLAGVAMLMRMVLVVAPKEIICTEPGDRRTESHVISVLGWTGTVTTQAAIKVGILFDAKRTSIKENPTTLTSDSVNS